MSGKSKSSSSSSLRSSSRKSDPAESRGMVIFSVGFYIVTSIVMVLVNKAVLNTIDLPVTFLTLQILVAVALLQLSHYVGFIRVHSLSYEKCVRLMPLIVVNVCGLMLNTLCLQYVDASFYQVARSLVLPFTVVFTWMFLGKSNSIGIIVSCAIVFSGFLVGSDFNIAAMINSSWSTSAPTGDIMDAEVASDGSINNSAIIASAVALNLGAIYGILSSITTALHAIVIKKALDVVKGNTMELVYYNNVLSFIGCLPIMWISGEGKRFSDLMAQAWVGNAEGIVDISVDEAVSINSPAAYTKLEAFMCGVLVTGFFGFLINIAGFLQIKVTSPVTHMISSAFRGVLQTALAVAIFGDAVSMKRSVGIFLILVGSSMYSTLRSWEVDTIQKKKSSKNDV